MEKGLLEIYKEQEKEIREDWDRYFDEVLRPKWEKAWKEWKEAEKAGDSEKAAKAKKKYEKIMKETTIADKKYQAMVDAVTIKIAHVNEIAVAYVNNEIPEIYATNVNGANAFIKETLESDIGEIDIGYRFDLMDSGTAKRLLTDDKLYAPLFKTVNIPKDKRWNQKLIHSQVTQGIFAGESVDKIAARIQNVTNANAASAVRNARTMCTTAENRGRMDSYEEATKKGIVMGKEWLATIGDGRTRDWHLALNGVQKEIDEPFENAKGEIMFPGDPGANPANIYNCRCTLIGNVIGFKKKDGTVVKVEDFMEEQLELDFG